MSYNDFKNRKIAMSFRDAFRGLWFCIKNERNMRIHTTMAAYILFFAPFLKVTRTEYAILLAVIATMITSEAFNTAIEKLCDYNCKNKNRYIGTIKDISAGAVLISAILALCVGIVVLFKPNEIMLLMGDIASSPIYIILLIVVVCISLIYIFVGPIRIGKLVWNLFKKEE